MINYIDDFGRIHDREITAADPYPCNNSFLFSGEMSMLGPVNRQGINDCWSKVQTFYGYDRNPNGASIPGSSHDEVVGMFMFFNEGLAGHWYREYQDNFFQVCNLPDFKPVPLYKLNPFKAAYQLWRLSREEEPRKATYKYPYIMPITFRHQPQHTYFYARCAGIAPGFVHTAFHFLSSVHTIYSGDNSGLTMLGFKLLKLKKLGLTRSEKALKWLYNKRVRFALEVMNYFPKNHPIAIAALSQYPDSVTKDGGI